MVTAILHANVCCPVSQRQIGVVSRKEPVRIGAMRSDSRYGGESLDKSLIVQENSRS